MTGHTLSAVYTHTQGKMLQSVGACTSILFSIEHVSKVCVCMCLCVCLSVSSKRLTLTSRVCMVRNFRSLWFMDLCNRNSLYGVLLRWRSSHISTQLLSTSVCLR